MYIVIKNIKRNKISCDFLIDIDITKGTRYIFYLVPFIENEFYYFTLIV